LKKVQARLDNLDKAYKRTQKTLEQTKKNLDQLIKKDTVPEPVFKKQKKVKADECEAESPCLLSSESASEAQEMVPIEK
jgi:hypothetical protein